MRPVCRAILVANKVYRGVDGLVNIEGIFTWKIVPAQWDRNALFRLEPFFIYYAISHFESGTQFSLRLTSLATGDTIADGKSATSQVNDPPLGVGDFVQFPAPPSLLQGDYGVDLVYDDDILGSCRFSIKHALDLKVIK